MTTPGKPVFGAGSLRYPQIMSPNFNLANPGASPANSWALLQSGLAYLFGVVLSGGTISGPDYVINTAGIFFYNGPPAAGNLAYTVTAAADKDPYGNAYLGGTTSYQQGSPSIAISQGITGAGSIQWQLAPSYAGPYGIIGSITCDSTGMGLSGGTITADGLTVNSAPFVVAAGMAATFGGPVTATAGTPASPTLITTDTWHPITLDAGWSAVGGFAAPAYRLLPDGNLQLTGIANSGAVQTANKNLNGSSPLPAAYRPASQKQFRAWSATGPRGAVQILTTGVIIMEFAAGAGGQFAELDTVLPLNL